MSERATMPMIHMIGKSAGRRYRDEHIRMGNPDPHNGAVGSMTHWHASLAGLLADMTEAAAVLEEHGKMNAFVQDVNVQQLSSGEWRGTMYLVMPVEQVGADDE